MLRRIASFAWSAAPAFAQDAQPADQQPAAAQPAAAQPAAPAQSRVLDSPFDFSFWIRNLADKRVGLGAVNFQNSFGYDVINYNPVRLYGADVTYRF